MSNVSWNTCKYMITRKHVSVVILSAGALFFIFTKYLEKAHKGASNKEVPGAFELSPENPLVGGNGWMEGKLCAAIEKTIGYSSVVDFGAGLGQYGRCLLRNFDNLLYTNEETYKRFWYDLIYGMRRGQVSGKPKIKSWEGYDGSPNIEIITNKWVKFKNLAIPFSLGKKFDWVISLEVGEHIPEEYEDIFIGNVVRHGKLGIILSWAVPGQGGLGHVNKKSNEYIKEKLEKFGLVQDFDSQKYLRANTEGGFSYFQDSLMVFRFKTTQTE